MDTLKRFGIKKSKAILLFVQMLLTLFLLVVSIFIPTVMSTTFGLIYNVRSEKKRRSSENTTEI